MSDRPWWRDGVVYQVYPRSFQDSDGDGIGDLRGLLERLDYVAGLGVSGLWLNPITPSRDLDWGYDVLDYCAVHPELGTLADLDALVSAAAERGLRVLLDLVPNHTSDGHPWFVEARSAPDAAHRDWYVWADPAPGGGPPNNWRSLFGSPAWSRDGGGRYYLHNFLPEQPDLNWWNPEVREAFDRIMRFWLDRGVAGFRIDVANSLVHDRALRDNPPLDASDHPSLAALGQRPVHNMNLREAADVHRRWHDVLARYGEDRVLLGETWVHDLDVLAGYAAGDGLHLGFNFAFGDAPFTAPALREVVRGTLERLPAAWCAWAGSNHDVGRLATRWCAGEERRVRCALALLLTLPGTPVLYYGDELGLTDVPVPRERLRDEVGIRNWPDDRGRDAGRTPMPWTAGPGGGFTTAREPWLPAVADPQVTVAAQLADPASALALCRDLIHLRRRRHDLRSDGYAELPAPDEVWAFARGDATAVAVNLSDEAAELALDGRILLGTARERDGEPVASRLALGPWEGAVVSCSDRNGSNYL